MINFLTWGLLLLACFLSWFIIYTYASKSTAFYVYFFSFIGYFLGFAIVALIPYDIYLGKTNSEYDSQQEADLMRSVWLSVYWTVFALCWFILPLIQEYEISGNFSFISRMRATLYRQARSMIFAGAFGLALVIFLLIEGRLTVKTLPVFMIILSNCWGLFLIIVLLGYGLIAVPRSFWNSGNTEEYLKSLYVKATTFEECITEVNHQLDEIIKLINAASHQISEFSPLKQYLEIIFLRCPQESVENIKGNRIHISRDSMNKLGNLSEQRLAELHQDLKKTISELERTKFRYNQLIEEAILLEDIAQSYNSTQRKIISAILPQRTGKCVRTQELIGWIWLTRVKPIFCRLLGILFGIMSILIVLGESTLFIQNPIGLFPLLIQKAQGAYSIQILVLIPLLYIILCSYYALFNLRLSGSYGLYPNNHTDPSNLVWSACILARLTTPLAYNFFLFIKEKNCEFFKVMKVIDLVPVLGNDFAIWFPLLLIVFCITNYFNIYGKIMGTLGLTQFSFDEKYSEDRMLEGKLSIQKSRSEKEREFGLTSLLSTNERINWEMARVEDTTEKNKKSKFDRLYY
ncbi:LMBRD2_4 [Blepharisma stoltei]|uniref:LMBR1 domain-containing protein 2 n=1 Tax=Blepharisma stoltei TaxID=1481888 RepID=A0AAU9JZZ1_9CILI|nr:unnamed protein product [Blepharisma stoltei]